uniref:Uncharacterized protein n=1 Tax=Setaria digitata TaxID=48799 RepID=A0A915PCY7_9BILA
MTKGICIRTNKDFGYCEEYPYYVPQTWFSCPGLYSNQIFGTYDMVCNPQRYGSEFGQTSSKIGFISDGHCIIRYRIPHYEVHCCCYWRFRQKCTIPVDGEMHLCASGTYQTLSDKEHFIESTLHSLPQGKSCFASFQLNITTEEKVQLVSTIYGVPSKSAKGTDRCYQYISTGHSIRCSATESCSKMCPLVKPFSAGASRTFTDFGQTVLTNNKKSYELTKCAYRHILQHIFSPDIYANHCIVYYDFSLMMPLNLIYGIIATAGYNMELERTAEEIYGNKEELIVADIFEYKSSENKDSGSEALGLPSNTDNSIQNNLWLVITAWTKCCTEVNANKSQIDRITKAVKAWTVAVLKCDGNTEPKCDANLIEKIDKNRTYYFNYYRNKYGRLCYLKDFIEQEITQNRSLETTWCYEETYGKGLDFMNRRDFMLEDKKLPPGKTCSHRLKTKIRYHNDKMFAYCFVMAVNATEQLLRLLITEFEEEQTTVCCCSSIIDKPCNFISEKYHVEQTKVHYTRENILKRQHCMLPDGRRDLCSLTTGGKVVCYYAADMKNRKVEGGCALSLNRKFGRHKLASICLVQALYNLASPVEFLSVAEGVKIFCCAGRDDCKESVLEIKRFKRFFETEPLQIRALTEKDFAFLNE